MTGSTILLTGGCGYIGSHVARQLGEQGAKVVVVDNLSAGFPEALLHGQELHKIDVGDEAALDKVFAKHKIDRILHFAANLAVGESVTDPIKYYKNNTAGTLNLVRTAVRHNVASLVFSSTAATYGNPKSVPVKETDPTEPESPYGWSKLMSERMIRDIAAATGLRYVILRYFNVAGADPGGRIGQRTQNCTHLIKVACEAALGKRKGMDVFGTDYPTRDGTCIRDYIHVEDLADAHVKALDYLSRGGSNVILNCGYGRGSSVKEVVAAVKEVSGVDFKVTYAPRRPGDVVEVVADAGRTKDLLGWTPRYDALKTIVSDAYRWEKKLAGV